MISSDKRLIEVSFPVKEVSAESAKEKNIRHGHISTLHIWWARRPLAASRATAYAALVPAPINDEELKKEREFIIELSKWENTNNKELLEVARKKILKANNGEAPKVFDPFGGGGSIPLENLRLGCQTYSNDLNPVAVLIQKCTLEYPQKYGALIDKNKYCDERRKYYKKNENLEFELGKTVNPLVEDIRYWGNWMLNEAKKELFKLYTDDDEGGDTVGYMWARSVPCQNPSCKIEIPLLRQFWLAKMGQKKISLFPFVKKEKIEFKVVGDGYEEFPAKFDPSRGTVNRAIVNCPACGNTIDGKTTRRLFKEGKSSQRMIAVITYNKDGKGKRYRVANKEDVNKYYLATIKLKEKKETLQGEWGIEPVPNEPTPDGKGRGAERAFSIRNYGINEWGELFNERQQLNILVFISLLKKIQNMKIFKNPDYEKAILTYLAIGIDRLVDFGSTLCVLNPTGGRGVVHSFGRQTIQIVWDYIESNPFNEKGAGWITAIAKNIKWIEVVSNSNYSVREITNLSATELKYEDEYFNYVFTDPPYYDNVPYAYLSDFFYVWLKRSIGDLYPDLFFSNLAPKEKEIVAYSNKPGGFETGKRFFEDMLKKSFKEIARVLKPEGLAIIVYAHKTTTGWEMLINSLMESDLVGTAAWPISTEKKGRLRDQDSAALGSSIYLVVRKIKARVTGFYSEVITELEKFLIGKLERMWKEGISGSDFFISAIGSAIEVFGKYEKIINYEGHIISTDKLLEDVRRIVANFTVSKILHNGFASEISELTRFYVLFRWQFMNQKVIFDEANKLAHGVHLNLSEFWSSKSFIKKEKEFISVLGPTEREVDDLKNSTELVDVLHHTLKLWQANRKDEMYTLLNTTGYGKSDVFYRVAQAISETLPKDSREKKLLDGFLVGRQTIQEKSSLKPDQSDLFE